MIIKVNALAKADPELVWRAWNDPEHICRWNAASDDWHTVSCEVDLRQGGRLSSRMEAKDGSVGFDFGGVYSRIVPGSLLEFIMDDGRVVTTEFSKLTPECLSAKPLRPKRPTLKRCSVRVGKRYWTISFAMWRLCKSSPKCCTPQCCKPWV